MKFCILGDDVKIELIVISRTYPKSDDIWDGNWITSTIRIEVPGYNAQFNGYLRTDELDDFLNGLKLMDKKLKGKASLYNLDGYIELEGEIDNKGKVQWTVETCYPVGTGAILKFEFCNDQSYLKQMINDLESVLSIFPVRE